MPDEPVITAIIASEKRVNQMLIKVGHRTAASLPLSAVVELRLGVGQPWDDALAARVREASTFQRALAAAMKSAGRRPLSRRRLDEKMRKAGWDDAMIARVIERLTQLGALDDEKLGRALVEEIQARKPAGPALLRAKLRQRGLENRLIEKLVQEVADDPARDPVADATELARKKLRTLARFDPATRKRRLWGLLARRGFNGETIANVLARVAELLEEDGV
jgi:regulatory protein